MRSSARRSKGSGIGADTARNLAAQGAKVTVLDVNQANAEAVAKEIGGLAQVCDVTSADSVQAALNAVDGYIAERARTLFRPVLEHLREVGEARSATEIEAHFKRNFDVEGVTTACEYLADKGLIGKVSIAVQLTKKSNVVLQELAFVHLGASPDDF